MLGEKLEIKHDFLLLCNIFNISCLAVRLISSTLFRTVGLTVTTRSRERERERERERVFESCHVMSSYSYMSYMSLYVILLGYNEL